MKIKRTQPWFAPLIWLFGMKPRHSAIYTWGKTIYAPEGVTADIVAHEEVHARQQQGWFGATRWWIKYLVDKEFRIEQEVQAYAAQMRYLRDRVPRRIVLRSLYGMSEVLASPMYDSGLTEQDAMFRIQERVHYLDKNHSISPTTKTKADITA